MADEIAIDAPVEDAAHVKMAAFKRGLDGIAARLAGGGAYDAQNVAACVLELVKLLGGNI